MCTQTITELEGTGFPKVNCGRRLCSILTEPMRDILAVDSPGRILAQVFSTLLPYVYVKISAV